jgi:iron-sulfur cluster assembly protein
MIAITEKASAHIQKLMTKQGLAEGGLRVGIKGGGCSGLSYTFSWEKEARVGDEVIDGPGGTRIFVDRKSLLYLNGTTLEYDSALMGKGLHFINPNAKASCGCGSSFTV